MPLVDRLEFFVECGQTIRTADGKFAETLRRSSLLTRELSSEKEVERWLMLTDDVRENVIQLKLRFTIMF